MIETAEKKIAPPGPSELHCRECGTVEQIRADWQRCWSCYMRCETRNTRTYPTFCSSCCRKLH
jgi:hypothetical protein